MNRSLNTQESYTIHVRKEGEGDVFLFLSGRIEIENLASFLSEAETVIRENVPKQLTVDLSKLEYLDSAGALGLLQLRDKAEAKSISFQFVHATEQAKRILELIHQDVLIMPPLVGGKRSFGLIEQVGEVSLKILNDFFSLLTFLGDLIIAFLYSLLHPRSIRQEDLFFYMKRVGIEGLPIVGLINFLLGLIIAFMSSLQLKPFGANIYVAQLVGVAMVSELGPIMTAVIVAGRSGSAFAAEIGTMKVNEEVDALISMGFDPIRFLAIPKILAAMLTVPLLTLYANFFGIVGGLVVGVLGLDLTVWSYAQGTMEVLSITALVKSLIKSIVFALLISGVGCQRGFQVRGGAEAVGASTTSAVVSAIFLIIVADSVFAILFTYL